MAAEGERDDQVDLTDRQAALAHALLLEAIDLLSQARALTDGGMSASLARHAAELTTLSHELNAFTD